MKYDEDELRTAYTDHIVNNEAIDSCLRVDTSDEAENLIGKTIPGQYISITNQNNLGEVFIYQRSKFDGNVPEEGIWDGKSSSIDWYRKDAKIQYICSASELRGFADLVNAGYTFKGMEVRLNNNIELGYYDWEPIGNTYDVTSQKDESILYSQYDVNVDKKHTFQGIFNGCGHVIYELRLTKKSKTWFSGFFTSILNAEINNISFEGIDVWNEDDNVGFSTIAGVAENSIFTNVSVSGRIVCAKPSGICGIAKDSSFYNCKNSVTLYAKSNVPAGLIAGGICQQLTISKNMLSNLNKNIPKVVSHCINNADIFADGTNAKYLWVGHFFGGTYYDENVDTFSFIMDYCIIHKEKNIHVTNMNKVDGETVFFGYDDNAGPSNNVSKTSKDDLLGGLIGRVDKGVTIEVRKATLSTRVNSMVIPGSVNTLVSKSGDNTFSTQNVKSPAVQETIYDLEPFFRYVKTTKK